MWTLRRLVVLLFSVILGSSTVVAAAALSDSPRDADVAQSSYLGGDHNIDPATVSQFKQLWNASFNPDEKHWARPLIHTLYQGKAGSGIVWVTEPEKGLLAFKAVPENGTLVELKLPKVEGANKYGRPVFGDGRVYVVDGAGQLIALGAK